MERTTDRAILKAALAESGMMQMEIADKLGVSQPTVSTNMRRDRMGVDVFLKLLHAMGYEAVVGKMTDGVFEMKWVMGLSDENE